MGHPGWDLVRRYRVHAALSGLLLAAALGSSPAHALCTSAGSSSTVCVVTDANEGPGTAANPTLRYAITEAINSGYTTVVTVNTGTLATISGAPFDLGGVAFGGNGGIRIDGPFGASSPQTFSVAGPALSFGSSATGTGSTLTFNADFSAGNLSLGNPVVLNRILSVTNSGQAHFDFLTVGASGSVALASQSTLSIGMVCPTFGSCISQLNGSFGGIFGAGDLVKTGTSRINMNAANTYSGSTTIEDGVLLINHAAALPASTNLILNAGVLSLNNFTPSIFGLTVNGNAEIRGTGALTFLSGTLNARLNLTDTVTLNGDLSGSGGIDLGASLWFGSLGQITLNGQNTYTGATVLGTGTSLTAAVAGAFSPFSAFVAEGTLNLNNFNQSIGSLAGAGTVALGSATLTTGGDNTSTAFYGTIGGGGGGLVKTGTGTFALSGANTYSGNTTLNAGSLVANHNNALGTGMLVFNGGTLLTTIAGTTLANNIHVDAGNGTIGGASNLRLTGNVALTGNLTSSNAATTTMNGGIYGPGGITHNGTGTLILNASNTYTGGTTVNAGTLMLGAFGTLGWPTAALAANGGTLNLGGTSQTTGAMSLNGGTIANGTLTSSAFNTQSGTVSAVLAGAGALTQSGSGTTTLSATNTYTGATNVNAGSLVVNGSIASSSLLTVNGGFVGGSGTLPTTLIGSGGTLAPGNSIGTIAVNGNLAFASGASYVVEVSSAGADRTNVTGTASLAGTVAATFAPGTYIQRNYTIMSAGTRSGAFGALTTAGLPAGFAASLGYTATEARLILTAILGQPPAPPPVDPSQPPGTPTTPGTPSPATPQPTRTPLPGNQQSVANALNAFFNNGGTLPPAFITLFGLTGQSLSTALNHVSGPAPGGAATGATQMMNGFLSLVLNPTGGAPSSNPGALGYARAVGASAQSKEATDAFAAIMPGPGARDSSFERRWSMWGQSYGGYNKTDGNAATGAADTSTRAYGFAGGADYRVTRDTTLGFALSGGETNWSMAQGLGGGKSDMFQAGLYGSHAIGAAYIAGAVSYAWYDTSTDRTLRIAGTDVLRGRFDAHGFGGRLEAGYRIDTGYAGVTPYLAGQLQLYRTPGYSETAASGTNTFALSYDANSTTATRFEMGSWFDRLIALEQGHAIMLRGRAAWAHDGRDGNGIAAVFQTLPGAGFTTSGAPAPKDLALVSAGGELRLASGLSFGVRFDGEFAGSGRTYAGTGTARYNW